MSDVIRIVGTADEKGEFVPYRISYVTRESVDKLLTDDILGVARNFIDIMDRYSVNPKFINLEITESASIEGKRVEIGFNNAYLTDCLKTVDVDEIYDLSAAGTQG